MRWNYAYDKFNENSGRVTYAKNLDDGTLDRSYDYDHVGRMWASHTGREARWHIGQESYTGAEPEKFACWSMGAFLIFMSTHYKERERINEINSAYQQEVTATCGPKPPHP